MQKQKASKALDCHRKAHKSVLTLVDIRAESTTHSSTANEGTKTIRNALLWPVTDWPNPQPLQPTPPNNFPLFPLRRQCLYHIYIYNQPHSLSRDPNFPNTHLPLYASSHPLWYVLKRVGEVVDVPERSQGNAELWYDGSQSLESSEYRLRRGGRRRQESGQVHHPTVRIFVSQRSSLI